MRLDRALVARGLARSRTHAQHLIEAGAVTVGNATATRASTPVPEDAEIHVIDDGYVSRAAHKLIGALDACAIHGLSVAGARALDAGASTGGFTQVLLERGAEHVTAIDVGHGQLAPQIANDPRVTAIEGLNVRDLDASHLEGAVNLVVADLSFISLTLVTRPLCSAVASGDLVLMVKPQFEVGKDKLGAGGVVTRPDDRAQAVAGVAKALVTEGAVIHSVEQSQLPGLTGNVEFFIWASLAWQASGADGAQRPHLAGAALKSAIEYVTKGRL
ncbi:TlyA family RNA methyltransferase [Demequina sp.]|uniref:TlyA family RNA methyltransferase n=1 Tax=Demequina sp. TaxID=2050685 RepID=UPI003D1437A6